MKYQIEKTVSRISKIKNEFIITQDLKQDLITAVNNFEHNARQVCKDGMTKQLHATLKRLTKNENIKVCSFDKGNRIVILDANDYHEKMNSILDDQSKFKRIEVPDELNKHPTVLEEGRLYRYLTKYVKRYVSESVFKRIAPSGSEPAKMYGTIKVHKNNAPARPIVSTIGAHNYQLARYLSEIIKVHINKKYLLSSTSEFIDEIKKNKNVFNKHNYLVSFDVESLFTNIPVNEVINIAADLVYRHESETKPKFGKDVFVKLCEFATQGCFMYNGEMFKQIDGVSMGSPLAPILANLFLAQLEQSWLSEECSPLYYSRYVDDCICLFDNQDKINRFHEFLNKQHPNLKFTTEVGNDKLAFLDVLINTEPNLTTSIYRKDTYTGILLNYDAICPKQWKNGLVYGMLHRAYTVADCWNVFHNEVNKISLIFVNNGYPKKMIERVVHKFIDKKINVKEDKCTDNSDKDTIYTVLPYIGIASEHFKNTILRIYRKHGIDAKVVFNTKKVRSYFCLKAKSKTLMKSRVVYMFKCLGDPDSQQYIGKTKRRLHQRVDEHKKTKTAVKEHVDSCERCNQCIEEQFKILYCGKSDYEVSIAEALFIKNKKPVINRNAEFGGVSYLLKIFN